MMRRLAGLVAIALLRAAPLAAQPTPDPAFVGHYYLSGVMETGSELLLNRDGRFEWFLAYGALDRYAKGVWARRGETIALVADSPDKQLATPAPFDILVLRIDGTDLLLPDRGRYSRE